MTTLMVVLITVAMIGLGALEICLFWVLGQHNDRHRDQQAPARRLADSPGDPCRSGDDQICASRKPHHARGREPVGKPRGDAGQRLRSAR